MIPAVPDGGSVTGDQSLSDLVVRREGSRRTFCASFATLAMNSSILRRKVGGPNAAEYRELKAQSAVDKSRESRVH
jgi:hypothetical protein